MTQSNDTARPPWRKLFAEGASMARLMAAQFGKPKIVGEPGDGRPVMVLPGFMGNDVASRLLRRSLAANGFRAYGWRQGFNRGADPAKFARLLERIDRINAASGQPLALVGWSLGGIYARELAKRRPDKVSLVITLGTSFSRSPGLNNARKAYGAINDHAIEHMPIAPDPHAKPPVHTIAMWSDRDGMVAPASASGRAFEADESIQLHCAHHDFLSAPEALNAVFAALARAPKPAASPAPEVPQPSRFAPPQDSDAALASAAG